MNRTIIMESPTRYRVTHKDRLHVAAERLPSEDMIVVAYNGCFPVTATVRRGQWYQVSLENKKVVLDLIDWTVECWAEIPNVMACGAENN